MRKDIKTKRTTCSQIWYVALDQHDNTAFLITIVHTWDIPFHSKITAGAELERFSSSNYSFQPRKNAAPQLSAYCIVGSAALTGRCVCDDEPPVCPGTPVHLPLLRVRSGPGGRQDPSRNRLIVLGPSIRFSHPVLPWFSYRQVDEHFSPLPVIPTPQIQLRNQ